MDFPKILRQLRKKKGIKQSTLGTVLNLSAGAISNYENGINHPGYDILCSIADYFEVSVDYLLGRTDYPHSDRLLNQRISGKYTVSALLKHLYHMPKESVDLIVNLIMNLGAAVSV